MSPNFDQGIQEALDAPDPELDSDKFVEEVSAALQSDAEAGNEETPPSEPSEPSEAAEPIPADEEEAGGSVDADTSPPPPTFVDVAGVQIPIDKAEAVANFYAWSQSPEGQPWVQALSEAMEKGIDPRSIIGPQQTIQDGVVTRPVPPPPPEEPEYFDPETAYKTLQQKYDDLANVVQTREAQVQAATQAQISFLVDSVRDEFAQAHELNPDESRQLVEQMDRTTVLAGYRTAPDGTTRDARSTLLAAMDAAYWAHPTLREKEVIRLQAEQKDRSKKDRKLAAVGGTSGSVPHRPEPTTPEERDAQAVEIIANAMGMKA